MALNSIINENKNFCEENGCSDGNTDNVTVEFRTRLGELLSEIYECQLNEESKEVAVSLASYVTKTLSMRSNCIQCKEKLILDNENNEDDNGKYMQLLSSGGLTIPRLALNDLIFQTFSIFFISPTIHEMTKNRKIRKIVENV